MRRILVLMSILVLSVFCFNSFVFAAVQTTSGLSKQIIDKANKGDAIAIQVVEAYAQRVLDAAKNGDPVAIEKLKNLECFDDQKVSQVVAKNSLKLKNGEPLKYYFDDGSAISFDDNSGKAKGDVSASAIYSKTKTWWFGPSMASLRTYIDNTGSTRYIAHIVATWGEVSSTACTMSSPVATIVKNDANPSQVRDESVVTLPYGAGTKSVWAIYNVDTLGIMTLVASS